MIALTSIIYYLSFKKPWKKEKNLPRPFFLTILSFIIFIIISKTLDFFLAISILSIFVSYNWGEKRLFYLLLVLEVGRARFYHSLLLRFQLFGLLVLWHG